jgi:hypothetical protein
MGLGGSAASTVCFGENLIKPKISNTNVYSWSKTHIWQIIWIQKDLGPMCFWNHGQSFSGKVYKAKLECPFPIVKWVRFCPLILTQGREPLMGSRQLCSLKPPMQLQVSEVKLACQEIKIADIPI